MKISNFFIWLMGVGLIVFLCVLLSGAFQDKKVLIIDGTVLVIAYTLALYVYGGLFASTEKFANDVPATGVKLYALWTYLPLVFSCITMGYVYKVSFNWQLFLQACLLFVFVVWLIVANASVNRMSEVATKSQVRHSNTDMLVAKAAQMKLAASLNRTISSDIQTEISKFAERVGFVSPSSSAAANMQENMLSSSIDRILSLVNSNASIDQLLAELENAKTILSQRMKTY